MSRAEGATMATRADEKLSVEDRLDVTWDSLLAVVPR